MKAAALCLAAVLGLSTGACVTAPPPAAPAAMANTATDFVQMATVSNAFEIETSQLAVERATDPQVRRFANRMISDHTRASRQMAMVLRRNGMEAPPPSLDPRHAAMLEQLRATPAGGFDAAYMTMQAQAHQEAVALFSNYASNGDDPALRTFATPHAADPPGACPHGRADHRRGARRHVRSSRVRAAGPPPEPETVITSAAPPCAPARPTGAPSRRRAASRVSEQPAMSSEVT